MTADGAPLSGHYLDGDHPVAHDAVLAISNTVAELSSTGGTRQFDPAQLQVSAPVGSARRFVQFPDGTQFVCADHPDLELLPQRGRIDGPVAWLEKYVVVAVAGIFLIAGLVWSLYNYGLPRAAELAVKRIPIESERFLGEQVLGWMDESDLFSPSELDPETRESIVREFDRLRAGLAVETDVKLEFRSSYQIGANAFALPGGTIVVTDSMVGLAESDSELAAVLAHELGHVEHRHILRHVVQNSVTAVLVSAISGDAASLSVAVVGLPTLVAQASYSRNFELQADAFAFALLDETGHSPEAFATLMERLDSGSPTPLDFLSSHPLTAERVANARSAASSRARARD